MDLYKDKFNKLLGKKIQTIRENRELSQEKFAEITGTSRSYVGEIERGEKSITVYKLYKMLHHLDISLKEFFEKL
ncbi:MAG: helix-turn-helix domain-containing protein [Candidatus Woesearchaeota archaeon]